MKFWKLVLAISFFSMPVVSSADTCANENGVPRYLECLNNNQLNQSSDTADIKEQLDKLQKKVDNLAKLIDSHTHVPEKGMVIFEEAELYQTRGNWKRGKPNPGSRKTRLFECTPEINIALDMTLLGAEGSGFSRSANRGKSRGDTCAPEGFCTGSDEWCEISSRAFGCAVKTEWYVWLKDVVGISPTIELVCK